jgi:hypothetical protein
LDLGDVSQLIFVGTVALVLGRVGLAFARLIERRASAKPAVTAETDDRLRALEAECHSLRQELTEVQERQDFTERALVQAPGRARLPDGDAPRGESVRPR